MAERPYLMALYADPCAYCGAAGGYVDHIQAASRGGRHHWMNYTATCGACNSAKRTTTLIGFLLLRRYSPERQLIDRLQAELRAVRGLGLVAA